MPDDTPARPESWVRSLAEASDRQEAARELVDARVEAVRYVDIDYRAGGSPVENRASRQHFVAGRWSPPDGEVTQSVEPLPALSPGQP